MKTKSSSTSLTAIKNQNILFLMSGSIAAYKACDLISKLVKLGNSVQVVASESLLQFVGVSTLEGLTGKPVITSSFNPGSAMAHIDLGKWCDLAVLCPASAHTINAIANGTASDPIGSLFLAFDFKNKKFFVAPAMNTRMYDNFATQNSLKLLKSAGVIVLPTGSGDLACGEYGEGRLLEPTDILNFLESELSIKTVFKSKGHILVTAGGTKEPIDGVRFIGNTSTGKTGAQITEALIKSGYTVHHLCPADAIKPTVYSAISHFSSYADLQYEMQQCLLKNNFDWVIHSAAVSDFSVESIQAEINGKAALKNNLKAKPIKKIESSSKVKLTLSPNKKLISQIASWSKNKSVKVIGFKLTNDDDRSMDKSAISKVFNASANVKYVIHNDLTEFKSGKSHPFRVFDHKKQITTVYNLESLTNTLKEML
jgi:phosphopantothenoylcysteine decarboxylase/phosphopantothenate--cysteine ligase